MVYEGVPGGRFVEGCHLKRNLISANSSLEVTRMVPGRGENARKVYLRNLGIG